MHLTGQQADEQAGTVGFAKQAGGLGKQASNALAICMTTLEPSNSRNQSFPLVVLLPICSLLYAYVLIITAH